MGGAAACPAASAPPAPARPVLVTRRGAVGPLGRVVAGPPAASAAAAPPEAAVPVSAGRAAAPWPAAGVVAAPASAPMVSWSRRAGTVSALTARNAVASATTGP